MSDFLSKNLDHATAKNKMGQYDLALKICQELLNEYPQKAKDILRVRSHIHAYNDQVDAALKDRVKILESSEGDIQDYYFAGNYAVQKNSWNEASKFLLNAIRKCREFDTEKYKQDSLFLLAYCLMKLHKVKEAREICTQLDNDFEAWVDADGIDFMSTEELKNLIEKTGNKQ